MPPGRVSSRALARMEARTRAEAAHKEARDNWPKNACPGRGRVHPVAETTSCPWCLPLSFYIDCEELRDV